MEDIAPSQIGSWEPNSHCLFVCLPALDTSVDNQEKCMSLRKYTPVKYFCQSSSGIV